ncbi:MAG TPA: hypothetical protein VFF79_12070 [Conexibacter sp.]|jgi:hypothetical protein|nr:hypothetical protein [Conexibacter sp.]
MTSFTSSRVRALVGVVAMLLLAAALAACGSSSSGAGTGASTTATTANGRPDFAKLRACLQQQGVTLPRRPAGAGRTRTQPPGGQPPANGGPPRGGGLFGGGSRLSGAERARLRQAMQKCGGGAFGRFGAGGGGGSNLRSAAFRKALVSYVACVRRNGFDLPAPNTTGSGPVFDPSRVDRRDPKFVAANARCQQLLAAARPGGAQSPGGGQPAG